MARPLTNAMTISQRTDSIRALLEDPKMKRQIQMAIPKHLSIDRLLRSVVTAVRLNPKLLECSQKSFLASVMATASLGLELDPALGQAYFVPFGGEVVFIPGYRGYITLARRSAEVSSVSSQVVYDNDQFELQYGLEEKLNHVPAEGDRGKAKGAYVVFHYKDGGHSFDYMSFSDIEKVRVNFSKQPEGKAWKESWDEMAKKTVIRRHIKLAPLSAEINKAATLEERAMAGESQFDSMFPELPAPEDKAVDVEGTPLKNFDELIEGKDITGLEEFLQQTAKAQKPPLSVDQLKVDAAKEFQTFWGMFEKWQKRHAKMKVVEPSKTEESPKQDTEVWVNCPNGQGEQRAKSYCETRCATVKDCPGYKGEI